MLKYERVREISLGLMQGLKSRQFRRGLIESELEAMGEEEREEKYDEVCDGVNAACDEVLADLELHWGKFGE